MNMESSMQRIVQNAFLSAMLFFVAMLVAPATTFAQTAPGLQLRLNKAQTSDAQTPNPQGNTQADTDAPLRTQGKRIDWRGRRKQLDRAFADELQDIALWCRSAGVPQQVPETYGIFNNRDLQRQYIFLPTTKKMPTPPEGKLGQWLTKVNAAKVELAGRIFQLASDAADNGDNGVAFQLLHEVIYYDRDHAETREILGHRDKGDSWQINRDAMKVKKGGKAHPVLDWPGGSYLTVYTPHFTIDSQASEQETVQLAESLEQWHDVWRQVFFEFWTSATVKRWIADKGSYREPKTRYKVAFFKDHAQYVSELSRAVKGVENSLGYYNQDVQMSFFSAGNEPSNVDTWRHELTHQLFRETGRSRKNPFAEHFLWLDEGIAMYFESVTDQGGYMTLGGFDTRRLQYARIRKMREGFFIPTKQLASLSQSQFQSSKDIASIYSQAAGFAHMLMSDQRGMMQPDINAFMKAIHKRNVDPDSLTKLLGRSYDQLDEAYAEFLVADSATVEKYLLQPKSRTEMALPNADLSVKAFEMIGQCENLRWLDLTGNRISPAAVSGLAGCKNLKQIFLTACPIERAAYASLRLLPSLEEIDLTASSVVDDDIATLAMSTQLKVLRLANTRVTDKSLRSLSKMRTLQTLDVSRSGVSDNAILTLKGLIPNLRVIK